MKIGEGSLLPHFSLALSFHYLSAVVVAAVGTQTMRTLVLTALRALYQRRSFNLPHIVATLITARFGMLSLGYRHLQHLLSLME